MRLLPIAAVALACALGGCSTMQGAVQWMTQTTTTPAEAHSVAAAADLYTAAATTADGVVRSGACDAACRATIGHVSAALRHDLDDALDAEAMGDSARVRLALDAFNQLYPEFAAALAAAQH